MFGAEHTELIPNESIVLRFDSPEDYSSAVYNSTDLLTLLPRLLFKTMRHLIPKRVSTTIN